MQTVSLVLVVAGVSGCWYDRRPAAPRSTPPVAVAAPTPDPPSEPSYRAQTIATDVVGVAALTVGVIGLSAGGNEDVAGGFLVGGIAVAGLGTTLIHLAHGRTKRAGASYLIRAATTSTGLLVGAAIGCGGRDELFCGLEGMAWGAAAGLALAGVIDAFVMHSDATPATWAPTMSVQDGDVRVGIVAPL